MATSSLIVMPCEIQITIHLTARQDLHIYSTLSHIFNLVNLKEPPEITSNCSPYRTENGQGISYDVF